MPHVGYKGLDGDCGYINIHEQRLFEWILVTCVLLLVSYNNTKEGFIFVVPSDRVSFTSLVLN